ncbi:MAG: rhomboid family intramembrane serine protease [Phycisphaerales bacterium JB037]
MGIYDRQYYREDRGRARGPVAGFGGPGGGPRSWSINAWLIIINAAVFVLGLMLSGQAVPVTVEGTVQPGVQNPVVQKLPDDPSVRRVGTRIQRIVFDTAAPPDVPGEPGARVGYETVVFMDPLTAYGHFSTSRGFANLEVWRLVTFQFLHANFLHLAFNMLGLWIFGGMVEQFLGRRKYLAFYLVCGVFGGLSYLLLNFLGSIAGLSLPGVLINDPRTPLVGASAGVFGVIMASAHIAPKAMVMLHFPPIPLQLRGLAYGYVGIALINLLAGGANAGGDAAHVGGALAGAFFIRRSHLLRDFFDVVSDSRDAAPPSRRGPRSRLSRSDREVDRVLDKVRSEGGLGNLSEKEREILRRASEQERG